MPCQRLSLPVISGGIAIISITAIISGTSIKRLEFIPKSIDESGKENGESVTATPITSTILNRFAPIILPIDSAE